MPTPIAQKYFDEAELFRGNGLYKEAVEAYKKTIEADPSFIGAYYNLALIYHRTQQFDNAITNLKKVIELDPQDASAYNNLGVLFCANNRLNEAKIYFEKALSLEANYKEAQDSLGKVLEKLRKASPHASSQQSIKFHCHKIGFVTLWYERGQAYVTKAIQDALDNQYNTFIFARNGGTIDKPMLQTTGEWEAPNLTTHQTYQIPHAVLKNWVVNNNLDVVFFNEEYDLGLVETAKQCGVKTVGYYVWELFDRQLATACKRLYDKIICPTRACYEKFKDMGMDNVEYIQWGVDLNLFKPIERPVNKRIRFFHPAGWGGLHARRGTQFVIDAFQKLNDPNAELLIHTQNGSGIQESNNIKIISGTVPREEIIKMYQNADVAVLPSKWEGLGLTFLEAIGCGLPIITVDAPPMIEFVHNNKTGFLCRVAERQNYPGIFVEGVHVDIDDMAEKMRMTLNADLRSTMRKNTIVFASEFSITKFKNNILTIVFGITKRIDDIRLNLGCGADIKQGYINIDQRWIEGVNQVADVSRLPYKDKSVTEVLANDVIEHFPREQTEMVLKEWIRVLRPDGILKIQCPDVRTLAYGLVYNQIPTNEFSRRIYGGQEYDGNFHYAGFDIPEMKRILRKLGMWPQQISTYNGNLAVTAGRKPLLNLKKLRITLIGARLSNYPWGTENFIHKAFSEFGHEIIDIDFRRDQNRVEEILKIPTDLVIAYKASGINPRLLETMNCPTVLWYPDDVLTVQHAQDDVRNAGYAYDHVYYVNRVGLEKLRQMGITHSSFLPPATDPTIYKYLPGTEKKHDIVFVGNIYPNRRALLDRLKGKFNVLETKAFMEDMVRIFNEAKIVLNLGVSNTGYNLRVFEALGCRSFLLTNEINREDLLFEDGKHLVYFNERNIEDLISHYLKHDDERESIAENGYREVCTKHTFKHRATQMLVDAGFISLSHDEKREAITQSRVHEATEKNTLVRREQKITLNTLTPAAESLPVSACSTFAQRPKRIFCAFPEYNAERINFFMPLERMGYDVIWYNWSNDFNVYAPTWEKTGKPRMNQVILDKLMKAHRESPVDLFFSYLSARTTYHEVIKEIGSMGITTLNFCCDDTLPVHRQMALFLAPAFDFWWTDNRLTVPEYRTAGARPIHAYLGANEEFFCPIKVEKKFDLSFIGSAHSYRPHILKAISDTGINVAAFGSGFSSNRVTLEEMVRIFSSCHINLGFAGIGARELGQGHKTLKGRDFEVPICGGLYMTEYTDEIKNIYEVGKEIVCYHTLDELLETVRYFMAHPDEMEQIRQAGRERALRDHTMSRRFEQVFREMKIW